MKLQVLVSAVNQDIATIAERMGLESDAIIINQTDHFGYICTMAGEYSAMNFKKKGLALAEITH